MPVLRTPDGCGMGQPIPESSVTDAVAVLPPNQPACVMRSATQQPDMGVLAQRASSLSSSKEPTMSEQAINQDLLGNIDAGGDYGLSDSEIFAIQKDLADEPNLTETMVDQACREAIGTRADRAEYLMGDR